MVVVSCVSWEADQGRQTIGASVTIAIVSRAVASFSLVPINIKMTAHNLGHDGLEGVLIRFRTEEDMATRLTSFLLRVELLTIYAERESNMAVRKDKDAVAFSAFVDVETSSALNLKLRSGARSDMEIECWSK